MITHGGTGTVREFEGRQIDQPILMNRVVVFTGAKIFEPVLIWKNNKIKAWQIVSLYLPDRG